MVITAKEQARRRAIVEEARHSSEMEGGRSSEVDRALQEAYVRGELTLDQFLERATDARGRD